jgi:ATP-dependent Clp protease ATP-binding subunit ClpC
MRLLSKWTLVVQCSALGMVRYTKKARRVVFYAAEEAMRDMSNEVTPQHLLDGLLRADKPVAVRFGLPTIGWVHDELSNVRHESQKAIGLALSEGAEQVISIAAEERERLGHKHTGTEHLLLGILRSRSDAARLLHQQGVTIDRVRKLVSQHRLAIEWGCARRLADSQLLGERNC